MEQKDCIKDLSNEKFDVYISYASEDRLIAESIYKELEKMGVNAWFDRRGDAITLGDPYWKAIESGIHRSAHFMSIITENWVAKQLSETSLKRETKFAQKWMFECSEDNKNICLRENYSIPVVVQGRMYNNVEICSTVIEGFGNIGIIPKELFVGVNMINLDANTKDYSEFEQINW